MREATLVLPLPAGPNSRMELPALTAGSSLRAKASGMDSPPSPARSDAASSRSPARR